MGIKIKSASPIKELFLKRRTKIIDTHPIKIDFVNIKIIKQRIEIKRSISLKKVSSIDK